MNKYVVFKIGITFADWDEFDDLNEAVNYRDILISSGFESEIFVRMDDNNEG